MLSLPCLFCGRKPDRSPRSPACTGAPLLLWEARPSITIRPTCVLLFLHFILQFWALFCCYFFPNHKIKLAGGMGLREQACCRHPVNRQPFPGGVQLSGKSRAMDTDWVQTYKVSLSSYQPGPEFLSPLLFTLFCHFCHEVSKIIYCHNTQLQNPWEIAKSLLK